MIEMLEPVSTINLLVTPLSTGIEGVPRSSITETEDAMTEFSGVLRRRELPSLTPLSRFPDFMFLSEDRVWV